MAENQAENRSAAGSHTGAIVLGALAGVVFLVALGLFMQGGYLASRQLEFEAKVLEAPDEISTFIVTGRDALSATAWLPVPASAHAQAVDRSFFGIYLATAFALILVVGLAVAFILQFKGRDKSEAGQAGPPNALLQGGFVLAAVILAVFVIASGFGPWLDQEIAPWGSSVITVTARQGDWDFTYPGGHAADTLHVPVGRPVQLFLSSEDTEHSLLIPALRINQAVLPGRQTQAWFTATVADTFALLSGVPGGQDHADMRTALVVHPGPEYDAWLAAVSDIFSGRTLEQVGELLYTRLGCKACHTTDGNRLVGPSFQELFGHEFDTRQGVRITADAAYIRESILEPNVSVIAGYEPVMTPYAGRISDREIEALTAWLQTLSSLGAAPEGEG